MSVVTVPRPPRTPVGPEPEALIEEARRRARRRRLVVTALVVVLAGAGLAFRPGTRRRGALDDRRVRCGRRFGSRVSLEITVYEGAPSKETKHFTLRCGPPS